MLYNCGEECTREKGLKFSTSYIIIYSRSFLTALSGIQSSKDVIYLLFTLQHENNTSITFVFWTNCSSSPNLPSKCIESKYISISCRNISLHLKAVYLVSPEKLHVHFDTTSLHLKNKKVQTVLHSVTFSKLMPVIFNVFSFPEENTQSRCPSFWGVTVGVDCLCLNVHLSPRSSVWGNVYSAVHQAVLCPFTMNKHICWMHSAWPFSSYGLNCAGI